MAAFQKFFLERIPDHAIVNDAVEIAKHELRMHAREAAFLNAVCRRLLSTSQLRYPEASDDEALSIRFSHPLWLVRYLRAKFGDAPLPAILESNNREADITIRVNTLSSSVDDIRNLILQLGGRVDSGHICPEALRVRDIPAQALVTHAAFAEGLFYLQDEGSQVVAHLVAPRPGERILDFCAAPGGKTTHLAEFAGAKAHILATDISESRLHTLQQNVARLKTPGVEIEPYQKISEKTEYLKSIDAVLVDAPCSGLGTLRRNPEIRYRITPDRLQQLHNSQLDVLSHAAKYVRPGGRLIYSTCTITNEENEAVLRAFLANHSSFALPATPPLLPPQIAALCQPDGAYRTWPAHLDVDGFEAAILVRTNS